ncbi:MAG: glycosyltransferase [Planctomycetota bacterium]|nr:glycosyltransferase [Planctomycetota bacterium]
MKILKVIHGYPLRYNAGSEVYSQSLCMELVKSHDVQVFCRFDDPFLPDYEIVHEHDEGEPRLLLNLVNKPLDRDRDRYIYTGVGRKFREVVERFQPDVVHIGHLNHLSTSIVAEAYNLGLPIVFTLHDYWLMCPRGQFMSFYAESRDDVWGLCGVQEAEKCAKLCYSRYFSGSEEDYEKDLTFWTDWVVRRMAHVKKVSGLVDIFIAPSRYLKDRFVRSFGLPEEKVIYLDYGFHRERLTGRNRQFEDAFTFGYIGTHIPAKGIHILIEAFSSLKGSAKLRIWGRHRSSITPSLIAKANELTKGTLLKVEWRDEYENKNIVRDVFNHCDAVVVPSIWVENSPLVIHEAQQVRLPVITANVGGMAEYVQHGVNGLLFEHRNADDLCKKMQVFVDDPLRAMTLGKQGYLYSSDGQVPSIDEHAKRIESIYCSVIEKEYQKCLILHEG